MNPEPEQSRPAPSQSSLTELCVPRDEERTTRHLAWAVSVCALFLAIGVVGFRAPRTIRSNAGRPTEVVPVLLVTPAELQPAITTPAPAPAEPRSDSPAPMPTVHPVVAPQSPTVLFPVPVKTPAILAPAQVAAPPAQMPVTPPMPASRFDPTAGSRSTPQPEYPRLALQRGYEGKVVVNFTVEPSGEISKVELAQSSGFTILDEAAMNVIRQRWQFDPGEARRHYVEIVFQLRKQ